VNKLSIALSADGIKVLLLALLLSVLYYSSLSWLVMVDWQRDDYSYGWMIPLVILYLLWEKQPVLRQLKGRPSWLGLLVFIPGLVLYWVGELAGEFFSQYLSFSLLLIGLCWLLFGWKVLKNFAFALLLTLAMYPPPNFLHDKLTFQLKLLSSELGIYLLHLYSMSAYREGNRLDLGFTQLQVVDACSGLRYLFPLIIMAILLAYIYRERWWKKCVLVVSVIPLTLVINALRIALTGVLYKYWGAVVAEGFFHDFAGIFIFMAALVVLLVEMWAMTGFRSFRSWGLLAESTGSLPRAKAGEHEAPLTAEKTSAQSRSWLGPPQFVFAALLLFGSLLAGHFVDFREKIPPARPFSQFPLQVADWQGVRGQLEPDIIKRLDLSDYTMMSYTDPQGRNVQLYTAYYQSQSKGESIHSPETCLPGSGWKFEQSGVVTVPVSTEKRDAIPVNSALMRKGANRQLVYFWFPQRDRIITNAYALKFYNFWDALTRQRTDGALVRLITPVYPEEPLGEAQKRLHGFTQSVVPVLDRFLPSA